MLNVSPQVTPKVQQLLICGIFSPKAVSSQLSAGVARLASTYDRPPSGSSQSRVRFPPETFG